MPGSPGRSVFYVRDLGIENDEGCAVTWLVEGEQRSSSIYCNGV